MNLFTGEVEPSMAAGVSGGTLFGPPTSNGLFGGLFRQSNTIQQPNMMQTNIGDITEEQMQSSRALLG